MSGYFNHRDPNQGTCTNSCRWDYKVKPAEENASGDVQEAQKIDFNQTVVQSGFANCGNVERNPAADQIYLIEEKKRPGQLMPIMEDEHGTYIMNSKDLRAVEHLEASQNWCGFAENRMAYQITLLCRSYHTGLSQSNRRCCGRTYPGSVITGRTREFS